MNNQWSINELKTLFIVFRSYRNHLHNTINNETFSSMFSDELSENDLVKKTFSEMSSNKNNFQMDSVSSSLSEQSSLGILELNNMSGN